MKLGQTVFFTQMNSEGHTSVKRGPITDIGDGIYRTRNGYTVLEEEALEKYSHARREADEANRRVR